MDKEKLTGYLIVIGIVIFILGIEFSNKAFNLIGFLSLIAGIIIKIIKRDSDDTSIAVNNDNKRIVESTQKKSSSDRVKYFKEYMNDWMQEDSDLFSEEYEFYNNNCCPSCGCVLEKKIKSSRVCPGCKEKIVLRTNKINSKKLLLSEKRLSEYDKHDKKRSEILYYEDIISREQFIYDKYMSKFYELKSRSSDARNVVYPFVNYVGSQLDSEAYKKYIKIINLPEQDMALESFEVIRQFNFANKQYFLLAEIANYKGRSDIALDGYATAAYRGVQISILDAIANPYHEIETIDIMGNVFTGRILKFLEESGYSIEDFKDNFLKNRHPFILEQISNEEAWNYFYDTIKLYKKMDANRNGQ